MTSDERKKMIIDMLSKPEVHLDFGSMTNDMGQRENGNMIESHPTGKTFINLELINTKTQEKYHVWRFGGV